MSHGSPLEIPAVLPAPPRGAAAVRTFVGLAVAHTVVDCFGAVFPMFKTLAGLDLAKAGLLATAAGMATLALQPVFGLWSDHGHRRLLITLGVALVCLTALFGPIARYPAFLHSTAGYITLFGVLATAQLGLAMFHPPAISQAGNFVAARRSTLVAVFIAAGMVGLALSHSLFSFVYLSADKHTELLLIPAGIVVAWLVLRYRPAEPRIPGPLGVAALFRRIGQLPRAMITLWLVQVLIGAVYMAFLFLLPDLLQERGYARGWVNGGAMALVIAGSAAIMVPIGHLADRLGRRTLVMACLLIASAGYATLLATPRLPNTALAPLLLVTGGAWGSINPLIISLGQRLAPRSESLVTGVLLGWAQAAAGTGQSFAGWLAESRGKTESLAWMGIVLAAAMLLAMLLPGTSTAGHLSSE